MKGNVITNFKWEVKEDTDVVLRGGERASVVVGKFEAREGNPGPHVQTEISPRFARKLLRRLIDFT